MVSERRWPSSFEPGTLLMKYLMADNIPPSGNHLGWLVNHREYPCYHQHVCQKPIQSGYHIPVGLALRFHFVYNNPLFEWQVSTVWLHSSGGLCSCWMFPCTRTLVFHCGRQLSSFLLVVVLSCWAHCTIQHWDWYMVCRMNCDRTCL